VSKLSKKAVSTRVFVAIVALLVVVAAIGYALYATKSSTKTVQTTIPTTVYSTIPTTIYSTVTTPKMWITPGLYNSSVVSFVYTRNYNCTPGVLTYFPNESVVTKWTQCEVGMGNAQAEAGAVPLWVLVPAFAGLSIFGVTQLGATPQGFPVFEYNGQNITILTDCGASGTPAGCPDHPLYLYSPAFTAVEEHLGIKNGVFGLPEGVLPTPAHDHLISCCLKVIPWYTIVVLVFDPNILPNPVTGECTQIVPSNLSNPTANCLNNFENLVNALTTHDSAVPTANSNNPIWKALGEPTTQVVVPGAATPAQLSNANSNLFEHFYVNTINPYLYYYSDPCEAFQGTSCPY
jgi:hypothetical protein